MPATPAAKKPAEPEGKPPADAAAIEKKLEAERLEDGRTIDATDGPVHLVTKIALAMAEADTVTKSSRNTDQGYQYASVEAILAATRGPLLRRGVALFQHPGEITEQETTARSGTKGSMVTVQIDFAFVDGESGESYAITGWKGQGIDYGDKAYGKAYTNAIKTFIRAQWMLPTGDDPEHDSPERGSTNGGPPAWAAPANAEQKAELVKVLTGLLHGNERHARAYARTLSDTIGTFPTVVAAWLCALPAHREAARATPADPDAEAQAAAQAASGEPEPDGEPEPEPDAPSTAERPAAGTLEDTPENRKEHCTCDEAEPHPETGERVDDACPLEGHGIPF